MSHRQYLVFTIYFVIFFHYMYSCSSLSVMIESDSVQQKESLSFIDGSVEVWQYAETSPAPHERSTNTEEQYLSDDMLPSSHENTIPVSFYVDSMVMDISPSRIPDDGTEISTLRIRLYHSPGSESILKNVVLRLELENSTVILLNPQTKKPMQPLSSNQQVYEVYYHQWIHQVLLQGYRTGSTMFKTSIFSAEKRITATGKISVYPQYFFEFRTYKSTLTQTVNGFSWRASMTGHCGVPTTYIGRVQLLIQVLEFNQSKNGNAIASCQKTFSTQGKGMEVTCLFERNYTSRPESGFVVIQVQAFFLDDVLPKGCSPTTCLSSQDCNRDCEAQCVLGKCIKKRMQSSPTNTFPVSL